MDKFLGWSLIILAVALSGLGTYFSIYGLAKLFVGMGFLIFLLAGLIDASKLFVIMWLKRAIGDSTYGSKPLKAYALAATVVMMVLTGVGVFGFLSNGHTQHEASTAQYDTQLRQIDLRIATLKESINQAKSYSEVLQKNTDLELQARQKQVLNTKDGGRSKTASKAAAGYKQSQQEIAGLQKQIEELEISRVKIEADQKVADADIGPLKFVTAAVYGESNSDTNGRTVKVMIAMIMSVFDPLAIAMLMMGQASLSRNKPKVTPEPETEVFTVQVDPASLAPTISRAPPSDVDQVVSGEDIHDLLNDDVSSDFDNAHKEVRDFYDSERKKHNRNMM